MALKKVPIYGIVNAKGGYRDGGFYELNKKGEPIKSSRVSLYARQYADTYEESVELYNRAIQMQIEFLYELIEECDSDKI